MKFHLTILMQMNEIIITVSNTFNYDWTPSNLFQNEYLNGFDNIRIENYQTSFNTLQPYTNYKLKLPNDQTEFLILVIIFWKFIMKRT